MKILMMTDMEGAAGILNHDDWVMPDGRFYDEGRRLLTKEVNAAVEGLFEGGATEVVVVDGHGAGGIDTGILDGRVKAQRIGAGGWPCGLDSTFDGFCCVGQHAKAGTDCSHITHTQWFNYIDLAVNDISIGEYGQMALCALELGVPSILACGEEALCREAGQLAPGVVTVAVKKGILQDGLDDLDTDRYRAAKLAAMHLPPEQACELIRKGAARAARKLESTPNSFGYPDLEPPYVRTARFRQDGDKAAWAAHDEHPGSIIALMNMPFTPSPPVE
jgi:D-amino peptidase